MNFGRNRAALAAGRIGMGVLTLVAVGVQLGAASHQPDFHPANFFGYFTILSNVFAALVLVYAAANGARRTHRLDVVRGAATLALAMVGAIFSLLLARLESNVLIWVNVVVHYVMPVTVVVDWLVDPPHTWLTVRETLSWLIVPLAYIVYTLIRGSIVHWYPYPFLNVDVSGGATVAAYVAVIFVFTLLLAAGVSTIGNALRIQHDRALRAST